MKRLVLLAVIAGFAATGCARFSTVQKEVRTDATVTITTTAKAWTFIQSESSLANWKATQSEGSQGAEVGSLQQSSDGTVVVDALRELNQFLGNIKP